MHEEWEIRSLPSEEKLEKAWRNLEEQDWSEMMLFGREKKRAIEKEIERNEGRIAWGSINRPSVNLNRWRCRDICWGRCWEIGFWQIQVLRKCQGTTHQIQEQKLDRSTSYRGGRKFLDRSTRYRKAVEIVIRKSLRSLTDSKVSRRCRASF